MSLICARAQAANVDVTAPVLRVEKCAFPEVVRDVSATSVESCKTCRASLRST